MFCRNCETDVTDMKYCPKCGTCVDSANNRSMNTANWKPLTEKDYYANYILACCITTLWCFALAWLHDFNTVEKYNGAGLDYIDNRALGEIVGMFIGIAIISFFKQRGNYTLKKIVTAIICSIATQLVTIVITFFMITPDLVHLPYSDIEMFEWFRKGLITTFIIVSILCLLCFYMFHSQKKAKIRTGKQEYQSAVFLTSIIGVLESLTIWVLIK